MASLSNDFDFLVGTFQVHNRRLRPDGGWDEFTGVNSGRRYADGQVVVDELRATLPGGRELTFVDVHAQDPATGEWTNVIHAAGAAPDWQPMTGRFAAGVGVFTQTTVDGTHLRHTWDQITTDSARFRQELSPDGTTWHLDWIMQLTRTNS